MRGFRICYKKPEGRGQILRLGRYINTGLEHENTQIPPNRG